MQIKPLGRLALILAAALLVLGVAAACGGGNDDSNGGPTATPTQANSGNGGNGGTGKPITIELHDNFFEPKDITVPVNTTVEITVVNKGVAIHNMHVLSKDVEGQDFTSDAIVNPGASSTFEVRFSTAGVFDFQCDYHLPEMAGTITVQ
ncbi:MAG: hypothetical protein Kow0010_20560 [Dehalococcoidia bacterium]